MQAAAQPTVDPNTEAMPPFPREPQFLEQDGLRLLGLSRIARCKACPRFDALRTAWENHAPLPVPWPEAPGSCRHQVCAPLVRDSARSWPADVRAAGLGAG